VSHDPSEIILICSFGAQETFTVLLIMLKRIVLNYIFVQTVKLAVYRRFIWWI